jgi:thioredoxin-like negative regulator of GroEL
VPREEAEKLFRAGREAYWQENHERALVLLEQCLELEPGHVEGLWSRSETLLALRRPEEALSVLDVCCADVRPIAP